MTLFDLANKTETEQKEILEKNATSKETYIGKDNKLHTIYHFECDLNDKENFQLENLDWSDS